MYEFDYINALDVSSEDQIAKHISGNTGFDYQGAVDSGATPNQIIDHLFSSGQVSMPGVKVDTMEPERDVRGVVGDIGVSVAKGIVGAGEAVVGLTNILTLGRAGKIAEKYLGYDSKTTQEFLSSLYSPAQQEVTKKVEEVKGFTNTASAMLKNPSTLGHAVVESMPLMLGGAGAGKLLLKTGAKVSPWVAASIGEGLASGGSLAESVRQQTEDGLLTVKQAAISIAAGAGTSVFGMAGGRLAQKLGVIDVDTLLVQSGSNVTKNGVVKRIIGGGISEGAFEEFPQSIQEQIWENAALDKPLLQGVPESAAKGILTGAVMGGGANIISGDPAKALSEDPEVAEDRDLANKEFLANISTITEESEQAESFFYDTGVIPTKEEARWEQDIQRQQETASRAENLKGTPQYKAQQEIEALTAERTKVASMIAEGKFVEPEVLKRHPELVREYQILEKKPVPPTLLQKIDLMQGEVNESRTKGVTQEQIGREGETVVFGADSPGWMKDIQLAREEDKKPALSRKQLNVLFDKVRNQEPLTDIQQGQFEYLGLAIQSYQGETGEIKAAERATELEKKGFELYGDAEIPVSDLNPGDQVVATIDGVKDTYTVKGINEGGNRVFQDGVQREVHIFGEINIEGLKRAKQPDTEPSTGKADSGIQDAEKQDQLRADKPKAQKLVDDFNKANPDAKLKLDDIQAMPEVMKDKPDQVYITPQTGSPAEKFTFAIPANDLTPEALMEKYQEKSKMKAANDAAKAKLKPTPKESLTVEKEDGNLIDISLDDLDYQQAYDAHRGTSHVPEDRAKQEQQGYYQHMKAIQDKFLKRIKPEQRATLEAELQRYKEGYLKKYVAVLSAKSKTMSSMITGPAKFPTARNQKRLDAEQRRFEELQAWDKKAQNSIKRELGLSGVISSDDPKAIDKLKKKLAGMEESQQSMKAANKIARAKKKNGEQKIKELTALGLSEKNAKELLKPDYAGRLGFASYQLTNNNANIKRTRERITDLEKKAGDKTQSFQVGDVEIIDNVEENRVQIVFDGKPSEEIRKKLKANAFKWSPKNQVWQRQRNTHVVSIAKDIVEGAGKDFEIGAGKMYREPKGVKFQTDKEKQDAKRDTKERVEPTDKRGGVKLTGKEKINALYQSKKDKKNGLRNGKRDKVLSKAGGATRQRLHGAIEKVGDASKAKITIPSNRKQKTLYNLGKALGLKTVFFRTSDPNTNINGFTYPETDELFINVSSNASELSIIGHEVLHQIKNNHIDLYDYLVKELENNKKDYFIYVSEEQTRREMSGLPKLSQADVLEEFIADFASDSFQRPEFWAKLNKKSPSLAKKLIDAINKVVAKIKSVLTRAEQHILDIDKAQDAMAYAIGEAVKGGSKKASGSVKLQTTRNTATKAFSKWFGKSKVVDENGDPLVVYHGTHANIIEFKKTKKAHLGFHFGDQEAANIRLQDTANGLVDKKDLDALRKIEQERFREWRKFEDVLVGRKKDIPDAILLNAIKEGNDLGPIFEEYSYKPIPEESAKLEQLKSAYDKSKSPIFPLGIGSKIGSFYLNIERPLRMPDVGNWGSAEDIVEKLPFESDATTLDEVKEDIADHGYDGIVYSNIVENQVMKTDSYIAFEPTQIKSAIGNIGTFDPTDPDIRYQAKQVDLKESRKPISKDDYTKNRSESKGIMVSVITNAKRFKDDVKRGLDKYLGAISTRLANINPKLRSRLRKLGFDTDVKGTKDVLKVEPLLKKAKKLMTRVDMSDWDYARKNSDVPKINELIEKYGLQKEYGAYRKALDDLRKEGLDVGLDIGFIEEYAPRVLKDPRGFLEAIGKKGDWPVIERALKDRAEELGMSVAQMPIDQKADLVGNMIVGGHYGLGGVPATKERKLTKIPPELNKFYLDSDAALMSHIYSMRKAIEARRFFGKVPEYISVLKTRVNIANKKLIALQKEESPDQELIDMYRANLFEYRAKINAYKYQRDYTQNISTFVMDLVEKGEIDGGQQQELIDILNARFHEKGTYGVIQAYKNLSYIDTMGSVTSALTQIGDLAWSAYEGGIIPALKYAYKAAIKKSRITKEDVGIQRVAQEFQDAGTLGDMVSKVFKIVGLEKMDTIGKEALLNSSLEKYQKEARKNPDKLKNKIRNIFEGETDGVIQDLLSDDITENVKLLVYNRLLDFQPVALSEMPQKYLDSGNGRLFYMLKSFTLKQFDVFRNEVYNKLKSKDKAVKLEAMKNLIRLSMFFVLANAGADELKDFVLGRKTDLSDRVTDNILRLFGISKFVTWKARTEGVGTAALKQVLFPVKFVDALTKDIVKAGDDKGLETLASIPVVGKLAYWHMGRGTSKRGDLWDRRFLKKKRKLKKISDGLERAKDKKAYIIKHRLDLIKLKQANKLQGKLNKYRKQINNLKARKETKGIKAIISSLEGARTKLITNYLKRIK